MYLVFDARRHDLVPLEDLDHCPATPTAAPYSTEGMHEFSRWGKEPLNGFLLEGRGRLDQQLDHSWDVGHY